MESIITFTGIDWLLLLPSLNSGLNHAWLNDESIINQAWIDQWSSSILVGFLITKMLTYIPNTYSLPAHKAVKEWMTLVALVTVLLLSSNIFMRSLFTHFLWFQIYPKQRSSLANSYFLLLQGLQLACVKIKSCVLIHCKQTTLLIPPWIGNLLAADFNG